jgi:hypothetical protein
VDECKRKLLGCEGNLKRLALCLLVMLFECNVKVKEVNVKVIKKKSKGRKAEES